MILRAFVGVLAGFLLLTSMGDASALSAFSADGGANVRAGPGTRYAVLAQVSAGRRIDVLGCLHDRSWCRTSVGGVSGWIAWSRLRFVYAGRPGEALDVPVVDFAGNNDPAPRKARNEKPAVQSTGRVLGEVTDRPGYCYVLDAAGNSVVVRCPKR